MIRFEYAHLTELKNNIPTICEDILQNGIKSFAHQLVWQHCLNCELFLYLHPCHRFLTFKEWKSKTQKPYHKLLKLFPGNGLYISAIYHYYLQFPFLRECVLLSWERFFLNWQKEDIIAKRQDTYNTVILHYEDTLDFLQYNHLIAVSYVEKDVYRGHVYIYADKETLYFGGIRGCVFGTKGLALMLLHGIFYYAQKRNAQRISILLPPIGKMIDVLQKYDLYHLPPREFQVVDKVQH
jgi:hypothetical protein